MQPYEVIIITPTPITKHQLNIDAKKLLSKFSDKDKKKLKN